MTFSEQDQTSSRARFGGEARSEDLIDQLAVAWTIRNRVFDGKTKS